MVRYLLPRYSGFLLLCVGSVMAAGAAVLYMLLYYCCRTLRPRRRGYGRHKREMYSSNGQWTRACTTGCLVVNWAWLPRLHGDVKRDDSSLLCW